uniref:Uncharacterized protein n=1 Tax=Eutreptiella gymnastica TaxID=73025 RepID=A0A7S4CWW3_9EUGL
MCLKHLFKKTQKAPVIMSKSFGHNPSIRQNFEYTHSPPPPSPWASNAKASQKWGPLHSSSSSPHTNDVLVCVGHTNPSARQHHPFSESPDSIQCWWTKPS